MVCCIYCRVQIHTQNCKNIFFVFLRHMAESFTFSLFLCPNTAFYGGIRAFFLYFKISLESLRDSKRQQISKFQSHFSAI